MAGEPNETPLAAPTNAAGGGQEPAAGTSLPAAAPAAAPAPEAAPAAAAPAAPAAPEVPAAEPSLLEKFDAEAAAAAEAAKKAAPEPEKKPAAGEKPKAEGEKPAAEAAPGEKKEGEAPAPEPAKLDPVSYAEHYKLPDTIKMDDGQRAELHTALDAFRTDPTKGVQGLIDLHNKTMQAYADQTYRNQVSAFNDTRKGWRTDVMADPELGGAGYQTTMGSVARMRDLLLERADPALKAQHRAEFDDFLKVTGAGDHPAFLRMLHNAARLYDEAPMPPPNPRPPADIGTQKGRGLRAMYKTTQGRQQ